MSHGPLATSFVTLTDPRVERTKEHPLLDIVLIAICAVVCGADGWVEVAEFGETKQEWFGRFLKLPSGTRSASHDTFAPKGTAGWRSVSIGAWTSVSMKMPAVSGKVMRPRTLRCCVTWSSICFGRKRPPNKALKASASALAGARSICSRSWRPAPNKVQLPCTRRKSDGAFVEADFPHPDPPPLKRCGEGRNPKNVTGTGNARPRHIFWRFYYLATGRRRRRSLPGS